MKKSTTNSFKLFIALLSLTMFTFSSVNAAITWRGSVSTDWNTGRNWSSGAVPGSNTDVTIVSRSNMPTLPNSVSIKSLKIKSGTFVIPTGVTISLTKNIKVEGGILRINGGAITTIKSLSVKSKGTLDMNSGNISVRDFAGNGTFQISGGTITVSHDYKPKSWAVDPVGGTIELTGAGGGKKFDGGGIYTFYNLTISHSSTGVGNSDVTLYVKNALTLNTTVSFNGSTNSAASLFLGGVSQGAGSWGSTASSATYTNNTYFSGLGIIRVQSVLSVDLLSFDVTRIQGKSILNWVATNQIDNEKFEVYRRVEGEKDFVKVGEVAGAASNSSLLKYSFLDDLSGVPAGNVYYKLKMVEFNGTTDESKVVKLRIDKLSIQPMAYPNPAKGEFRLNIGAFEGQYAYSIVNISGKVVMNGTTENGKKINVSTLSKGRYFVNIPVRAKVISIIVE